MTSSFGNLQRQPPSPPQSNDEDFPGDLQHIIQYNTSQPSYHTPPKPSRQRYTYSPVQSNHETHRMDPYGNPVLYQTGPTSAYEAHQNLYHNDTRISTPPASEVDGIHTRSGKKLMSPVAAAHFESGRSRVSRAPRMRKPAKPGKEGKTDGPQITEPLSILTRDYDIPIKDMETWVKRSAEVRRAEAASKDRVPRPMNSFMLYRSAFAERVKKFCKENNHQVVSKISGFSWPLEPKDVRDFYEHLASLERDNHAKAHPEYKFAPNKGQTPAKKRKAQGHDNDEPSDLDDEGSEWGAPSRTRRQKRARTEQREADMSQYRSSGYDFRRPEQHGEGFKRNSSTWQNANPGRPNYVFPGLQDPSSGYMFSTHPYGPGVEDVRVRRVDASMMYQGQNGSLIGLPGSSHQELLAPNNGRVTLGQYDALDPRLGFPEAHANHPVQYSIDPYEAAMYGDPRGYSYQYDDRMRYHGDHLYQSPQPLHPGDQMLTQAYYDEDGVGSDFNQYLGE